MSNISIITIGDELLIGQVVDTNSAWMAQELNKAGFRVTRRVAVGDVWEDIWKALDEECQRNDIVLLTGGLGPTADDITKPLLCEYFGGKLVVSQIALDNVTHIFEQILKRPMIERNRKQAEVPDNCKVIPNRRGTAPGMWFEKNGKVVVSMPGVPHEMKGMMETDVIPALQQQFPSQHIVHKTLLTAGIGESFLAEIIEAFEQALPDSIKLAYLPQYGMVRLRLTATGAQKDSVEQLVQEQFEQLQQLVQPYLVTDRDEPMQMVVSRLLKDHHKKIATAESCTGGYIAHLLTVNPGASECYEGGVVSYSYASKERLLGVVAALLQEKGAVCEEVVRAMLTGLLQSTGADYGIAVSGIMGPDGGTAEKPVGTVWIAVGSVTKIEAEKMQFRFDRQRNIELTATNALNLMRKFILRDLELPLQVG